MWESLCGKWRVSIPLLFLYPCQRNEPPARKNQINFPTTIEHLCTPDATIWESILTQEMMYQHSAPISLPFSKKQATCKEKPSKHAHNNWTPDATIWEPILMREMMYQHSAPISLPLSKKQATCKKKPYVNNEHHHSKVRELKLYENRCISIRTHIPIQVQRG
jgi:hypothetical protein